MTRRIVTAPSVRHDVRRIARYIAGFNREIAARFEPEFWNCVDMLRVNPEVSKAMPGTAPPIRFVRVSERFHRYLVFYRILSDGTLQIGRVLHRSRDVQRAIGRLYPNRG